jgi:predicted CXXCH cytochrome family protein
VKLEGLNQVLRYWTKLYVKSKPWAEIPDESCLRPGCHEKRLLEGQVQFQKVVFDHRVHLTDLRRGKKLRCTSCHSQIVQGAHIVVTETTCFICHFKKSEHYPQISSCSHCHVREELVSPQARFNHTVVYQNNFSCDKCHSQVIIGDGAVPRENCFKCHFEKERVDRYGETDFVHSMHITSHKIECNQCHLEIQHKIVKDIEAIADCRTCHTGFHQAQKILYTGEGGKGVSQAMPNVMLQKGMTCKGCHMFHESAGGRLIKSDTMVSRENACASCHGPGFPRLLRMWQTSTKKKLVEIKAVYGRAAQEIEGSRAQAKDKAKELLQDAAFNIDVVERGKAVHNIAYSQQLLLAAFHSLEEGLRLTGSSYRPPRLAVAPATVPGQCSECHAGIEEINVEVYGLSFAHKPHVVSQKMDCAACHSGARRHGELIVSKKDCAACHHQDVKRDCGGCHALQKTLFTGGIVDGLTVPKDMMAEGGVGCDGCHPVEKGRVKPADGSTCVACHEESYKKTLADWQNSFNAGLARLDAAIREKKKTSLTPQDKTRLAEVEQVLEKLKADGSLGAHNFQFVDDVLTKLGQKVKSTGEKSANE